MSAADVMLHHVMVPAAEVRDMRPGIGDVYNWHGEPLYYVEKYI